MLAVLAVAAFLIAPPAGASRLQTARERLASLERQIEQQTAAISAQHRRIAALETRLAEVRDALRVTMSQLVTAQHELADAKATYRTLQDQLGTVARAAYEQGPFAPVEAVLGATSFGDLMDRLEYLDNVQASNSTVANGVAHQAAKLRITQHDLTTLSSKQASQSNQLQSRQASLLSELLGQQQQLASLSAERRKAAKLVRLLSLPPDPALTGAGVPFGRWAELFLGKIGAPTCQDNLTVVVAWEVAEGTAAAYNPLATTHDFPGATVFNSVGVKNYPSLEAGLQATEDTLRNGSASFSYGPVLAGLAGCAPAETTATAVNASAWCRGCAGGMYVLDMLPLVEADYARFAGA